MEQDRGFDNPFSAFEDLNFDIDEGTPEETKLLELSEQDLQETQESLALVP